MYIDSHVHCRDEKQREKETIAHVLRVAERTGVDAVFDIVNTDNPVLTRDRVEERLEIADSCNSKVFYGVYLGVTPDPKQIEEGVKIHEDFSPRVVGFKMFAGKSVGDLSVPLKKDQDVVWKELGANQYDGVTLVHCEKEEFLKPYLFNPEKPITHCYARPEIAEVESIKDQIELASKNKYAGKLVIAHVSNPESVRIIDEVRQDFANGIGYLDIFCEASPGHLFLYDELMNDDEGLLLKVNPALRSRTSQQGLLKCLREGKIDMIATDHAPHKRDEKLNNPYMSGIPWLDRWPHIVNNLKQERISEEQISNLTFNNAVKIFSIGDYVSKTNNSGQLNINEYGGLRPQNVLSIV